MRLTEIKLAGFKSFVDPTHIPVPGQLVGIVGPNGCGKSNIIDAVRWVLGESSAKHLRGETMQDVLFRSIPERLARALLARESGGVVDATHQAIASELGSAREVVSRILQKFERDGLIAAERGRIVIRNGEALRRMAAPEP